eukprot:4379009-Ditylum_brightwellii.AAC.1
MSEANEHTFGGWKGVLHEFNLAQLCGIEKKHHNYVDAVFKEIFGEYIESATKASAKTNGRAVNVDYEQTAG